MAVVAGVDVGNATTEVAVLADGRLLGADRLPTRGRKGSADSLRGAAALVRRIERRLGVTVDEARVAPLRAVDTATLTVPDVAPPTGRLRLLAAGVATPGGAGACVGVPLWLDQHAEPPPASGPAGSGSAGSGPAGFGPAGSGPAGFGPAGFGPAGFGPGSADAASAGRPVIAVVPPGLGFADAADRLRGLRGAGVRVGAVLVAGDEGVLIANRLGDQLPVIDQVDPVAIGTCTLLAVEVRPPGQPLRLLADPVALGAALSLDDAESADATTLSRALLDYSNAVVGLDGAAADDHRPSGPWVVADGQRVTLRAACAIMSGWPVGAVRALCTPDGQTDVDDLFAVDLGAAADTATARQGGLGRAVLVASLNRLDQHIDHAAVLTDLLRLPVRCLLSEPSAARLGARTTPGARADAVVVDVGAGTLDVIAPGGEVVAAGAGDLLTAAVAETLGVPRAAADWVKRGPCLRVTDGQRFEAEDGTRGFLDGPAAASVIGMLAAAGPAGLLPFDRRRAPAEWRAIRLRLKQAVFAVNLDRALRTLGQDLRQVLLVGGPAGDDELLGVLLRTLPGGVPAGRASVGGTLPGQPVGHRYAVALGLALSQE